MLRLRIFATWGIGTAPALAGTLMNVLSYYTNRLLVPTIGVAFLLAVDGTSWTEFAIAALALSAGLGLIVVVRLAVRDPGAAGRIGLSTGRLVCRVRSSVDPQRWMAKTLEFRSLIADRFPEAFPRSLLLLAAMTLVDATVLLLAIRFVGVPTTALPTLVVVGGFLVWFPLTVLPLSGLGVLDAALLAMYTATAGTEYEAAIFAGLIIYRLISIGGTALLGLVALVAWRRTSDGTHEPGSGPAVVP